MPRGPRELEKDSVYHIMVRGNNKQNIFMEAQDYRRYLEYLERVRNTVKIEIFCYALMPNHVHLLVKSYKIDEISRFMQRIQTAYSMYFNIKYKHVGHVFQGRFRSKLVKDDAYLVHLSKYIHLNPIGAGLCQSPFEYRWSSYKAYCGRALSIDFVNTSFLLDIFRDQYESNADAFRKFTEGQALGQGLTLDEGLTLEPVNL